jgi:hypothetical protein
VFETFLPLIVQLGIVESEDMAVLRKRAIAQRKNGDDWKVIYRQYSEEILHQATSKVTDRENEIAIHAMNTLNGLMTLSCEDFDPSFFEFENDIYFGVKSASIIFPELEPLVDRLNLFINCFY